MKAFFRKMFMARPSMYSSSLFLNIFGMQWLRRLVFFLHRVVRIPKSSSPEYASWVEALKQDGYVALPNFLFEEDYKKVFNEFQALSAKFDHDHDPLPLPHVERMKLTDGRVSDFMRNIFMKNPLVEGITAWFLNRKYHLPQEIYLTRIYMKQNEIGKPKHGGPNVLHFDAPTRVLKFFYYISDTNENNYAFTYAKGSNRRNLKLLWFEYLLSIRYALNKRRQDPNNEYPLGHPWVEFDREEAKKYGLEMKSIPVKGNTLLIADTGGFHQRGEFLKEGVRETIEINFRDVETLRNDFYPLEMAVRRIFGKGAPTIASEGKEY